MPGNSTGRPATAPSWTRFRNVESMHTNFYENEWDWDDVEDAWVDGEELVERLEALRGQPPAAYTPRSESDQRRLARLLGYDLRDLRPEQSRAILNQFPLGVRSPVGFAPQLRVPTAGR